VTRRARPIIGNCKRRLRTVSASGSGSGGGGDDSGLPEEAPLPAPKNVVTVSNASQLNAAVQNAAAGDHIVLASGSYGSVTLSRDFPADNRLVIRAQTLLGAKFTSLVIAGDGIIVSGVSVDVSGESGQVVRIDGSNVRLTRCAVRNGGYSVVYGPGVHDVLVDHCDISRSRDQMFWLQHPADQKRLTVARNWVHELLPGGDPLFSLAFNWMGANAYRERHEDIIVRLNYMGPGLGKPDTFAEYIHHKGSHGLYAFNNIEASGTVEQRFGIRPRYVGNYAPQGFMVMWDDLGWYFGNLFYRMRAPAGKSAYYDDTKNLWDSVGGFHANKRTRYSANKAEQFEIGSFSGMEWWCTATGHPTLPDPQPAGGVKPERTYQGVTYAGDNSNDPNIGIKIRAHSGAISEGSATCIDWAQNIDRQPNVSAPASWLSELLNEYPWISSIVPDPTSPTGGPNGSAPWSVAQSLVKDGANPSVGPQRKSSGGLAQ
jgi:hypothetical protein